MIKSRLISCIVTRNELVVQSFGFNRYLPIGNVKTAVEFFVNWDVDEIFIIDISASAELRPPNIALIEWAASECYVPMTVGGGIKTTGHIRDLLRAGADKVSLNSIVREDMGFISKAANIFGNQCITVSVDVKKVDGTYRVFDHIHCDVLPVDLFGHLRDIQNAGAGEILINSVDRDGSREGYDLELLSKVSGSLKVPVIALGGVGRFEHLSEAVLRGGCQAAAAANIFQHMEHSTIAAKAQMKRDGLNVRLCSEVQYADFSLDILGRPF
jgi:cyclase